ncbi:MAG: ATP-binding protein [Candidatus Eisenbacteria sp.]|nr:ATP-binding protein [Candidatus Eisenbacteria bacterium]
MTDKRFHLTYSQCRELLRERLAEPAPGRIQLLTGPRQVGKTNLLNELEGLQPKASIYAAVDGPEAGLPGFWDRLWIRAEELASERGKCILLLDEIQHLGNWAIRLKGRWDRVRRRKVPIHVVATGSSALNLGKGTRESLAGRFERITLGHWPASGIAETFAQSLDQAVAQTVSHGCYPGAMAYMNDQARWRAYMQNAIIEPAIGRDILALGTIRRPELLRQVFSLCTTMPAHIVSLQKLQGKLQDPGALETIASYLQLLEDAFLVAAVEKYSQRALRRRKAPPKIVVLNNAFLAALDPEGVADQQRDPKRFGSWVENACLAYAWNAGQRVMYWREEPLEIDAVLEGSWGKWAVEVKTRSCNLGDLRGLLEFCRRNPKHRPLILLEKERDLSPLREAGVAAMRWQDFLGGAMEAPKAD